MRLLRLQRFFVARAHDERRGALRGETQMGSLILEKRESLLLKKLSCTTAKIRRSIAQGILTVSFGFAGRVSAKRPQRGREQPKFPVISQLAGRVFVTCAAVVPAICDRHYIAAPASPLDPNGID